MIVAALVVAAALVPITFRYQNAKIPPIRQRAWRMNDLQNITEPKALERFGKPIVARDFQMTEGSFIGPRIGLKHFVRVDAPDYEARLREPGTVSMQFPQFTTIRELVWKLPDSYLTLWLFQPRAEVDFRGDYADLRLPNSAPGVWAALDNYRVGLDLVKPPASARPTDKPPRTLPVTGALPQRFGSANQLDETSAITAGIRAFSGLGQFRRRIEAR